METIIVYGIGALAIAYMGKKFFSGVSGKGSCGGGCGSSKESGAEGGCSGCAYHEESK